jgi:hypothetical protein
MTCDYEDHVSIESYEQRTNSSQKASLAFVILSISPTYLFNFLCISVSIAEFSIFSKVDLSLKYLRKLFGND